jgi:hypothetical protein
MVVARKRRGLAASDGQGREGSVSDSEASPACGGAPRERPDARALSSAAVCSTSP